MSSKAGSAKKRRRIVAMLDESSDEDDDEVEVYSIHSDGDDGDESSVLEDFEDLWQDTTTKKKEANICTQPPPQQRRQATPLPKEIHAYSPESLAMSSIGHSSAHEKRPAKVSLSPTNKTARVSLSPPLKLVPANKVTMLEQVVTKSSRTTETVESMDKHAADKSNEKVKRLKSQDSSVSALLQKPKDAKKESDKSTKARKDVSNTKSSAKKDAVKESTRQTKTSKADEKIATKVSDTKSSPKKDATKTKERNKPTKASAVKKVAATDSETKSSSKKDIPKEATKPPKASKDDKVATNKGSKVESSSEKDIVTESTKPMEASKEEQAMTVKDGQDPQGSKSTGKRKSNDTPEPPKKKKRTFQDQILSHMLTACKPFTLKSLAQSLQTTDASINWAILSLLDKGLVIKKEFAASKSGRTKELYWANQDATAKEVRSLLPDPQEIRAAQEEYSALRKQDAGIVMEMNVLQHEPGNEELSAQLAELEEAVRALQGRLKATKDRIAQTNMSTKKSATKEQCPHRMKLRINFMRDEWKKRKTKCMDFVDQLADGMEKKQKDVIKLLDLETDEMENVIMPPKYVV